MPPSRFPHVPLTFIADWRQFGINIQLGISCQRRSAMKRVLGLVQLVKKEYPNSVKAVANRPAKA